MTKEQVGHGSILGALIGDAAGAVLEGLGRAPRREEAKRALLMQGGGIWQTAPGQITDDGELALCLMGALAGQKDFEIEKVALAYLRWLRSQPFDIGTTTHNGLSGGFEQPRGRVHIGMWNASKLMSGRSKSNGGLMRIAPLGVWGHRLSEEGLVEAACQDCRLTHGNAVCQYASATYCVAIRHLMLNPGDGKGAAEAAMGWARRFGNIEILDWLDAAEKDRDVGYHPRSGFVRYGYTHAFRHLIKGSPYIDSLFETLSGGGDTDTNACIVGGLVGALHGVDGLPVPMIDALLSCNTRTGRVRPEFLQTKVQLPGLLEKLVS